QALPLIDREKMLTARAESRPVNHVGWGEDILFDLLVEQGEVPERQLPAGTRNIDLAIKPVAVEVWLSSISPLQDPYCRSRLEYLSDRGWWICYIFVARRT